jgi:hypothetical protein
MLDCPDISLPTEIKDVSMLSAAASHTKEKAPSLQGDINPVHTTTNIPLLFSNGKIKNIKLNCTTTDTYADNETNQKNFLAELIYPIETTSEHKEGFLRVQQAVTIGSELLVLLVTSFTRRQYLHFFFLREAAASHSLELDPNWPHAWDIIQHSKQELLLGFEKDIAIYNFRTKQFTIPAQSHRPMVTINRHLKNAKDSYTLYDASGRYKLINHEKPILYRVADGKKLNSAYIISADYFAICQQNGIEIYPHHLLDADLTDITPTSAFTLAPLELIKELSPQQTEIQHLELSPDGKYLLILFHLPILLVYEIPSVGVASSPIKPLLQAMTPQSWIPEKRNIAKWTPEGKLLFLGTETIEYFDPLTQFRCQLTDACITPAKKLSERSLQIEYYHHLDLLENNSIIFIKSYHDQKPLIACITEDRWKYIVTRSQNNTQSSNSRQSPLTFFFMHHSLTNYIQIAIKNKYEPYGYNLKHAVILNKEMLAVCIVGLSGKQMLAFYSLPSLALFYQEQFNISPIREMHKTSAEELTLCFDEGEGLYNIASKKYTDKVSAPNQHQSLVPTVSHSQLIQPELLALCNPKQSNQKLRKHDNITINFLTPNNNNETPSTLCLFDFNLIAHSHSATKEAAKITDIKVSPNQKYISIVYDDTTLRVYPFPTKPCSTKFILPIFEASTATVSPENKKNIAQWTTEDELLFLSRQHIEFFSPATDFHCHAETRCIDEPQQNLALTYRKLLLLENNDIVLLQSEFGECSYVSYIPKHRWQMMVDDTKASPQSPKRTASYRNSAHVMMFKPATITDDELTDSNTEYNKKDSPALA